MVRWEQRDTGYGRVSFTLGLFLSVVGSWICGCDAACPSGAELPPALDGYKADLVMQGRQARGTVTVVDACTFRVDMLEVSLMVSYG